MEQNATPTAERDQPALAVRSDWSVGPRTAAWDRLWRKMLAGLGPVPPTDARESLESEVGDA